MTGQGPGLGLRPGEVRPFGERGLLVGTPDAAAAASVAGSLRSSSRAGIVEAVGGQRSILVEVDPAELDPLELSGDLAEPCRSAVARERGKEVALAVSLEGPDLEEVGRTTGLGAEGVAESLRSASLEVAFLGFAPGFAYLVGLAPPLAALARRSTPRPVVPPGSLALAAGFAAVYPSSSPGGWHLVGHCDQTLFDPEHPPYALLEPGDRVVLTERAGSRGPAVASRSRPGDGGPPCGGTRGLRVEAPGLATTLQDGGRLGWAHLGVPRAGPADPVSHCLANRLVGNDESAAALEVTAQGPVLRALAPLHLALVGLGPRWTVDGWEAPSGQVVPVEAGQRVAVEGTGASLRAVLAVAGALSARPLMGSVATDSLSGLGGPPLRAGDELAVGEAPSTLGGQLRDERCVSGGGRWTLRVLPGPHAEWFPADVLELLGRSPFQVAERSNRVGLRLEGAPGVPRHSGELDPQGMVTGAVQVPPDGVPVVLLPDHATHGGYPAVAVVIEADRHLLGRCRPGDEVRLEAVDPPGAAAALRRDLDGSVSGHYPRLAG